MTDERIFSTKCSNYNATIGLFTSCHINDTPEYLCYNPFWKCEVCRMGLRQWSVWKMRVSTCTEMECKTNGSESTRWACKCNNNNNNNNNIQQENKNNSFTHTQTDTNIEREIVENDNAPIRVQTQCRIVWSHVRTHVSCCHHHWEMIKTDTCFSSSSLCSV